MRYKQLLNAASQGVTADIRHQRFQFPGTAHITYGAVQKYILNGLNVDLCIREDIASVLNLSNEKMEKKSLSEFF